MGDEPGEGRAVYWAQPAVCSFGHSMCPFSASYLGGGQ
jgi:hypothetical protein